MDLICRYWAVSPALHLLSHAPPHFCFRQYKQRQKTVQLPPLFQAGSYSAHRTSAPCRPASTVHFDC